MLDDFKSLKRAAQRLNPDKAEQPRLDTPLEAAAAPAVAPVDETIQLPAQQTKNVKPISTKRKWWHVLSFRHTHLSKPKWALLVLGLVLMVLATGFGAYKLYQHYRRLPADKTPVYKNVVIPKTEPSRLTGLPVDPALNKRPVTGVMIENSPDARPQAGLRDAGIVFEAIAEGGITRFLALFEDTKPNYIGPVRSVRPYYVDWAFGFDASIAHVGGSPDGLAQIRSLHARDLDEFANASTYRRITSRYAPHNVYTSTASLDALNKRKGYTGSTFTSWARKPDQPKKVPRVRTIDLEVSGFLYSPHYVYDAKSNSYRRSEGGQPHKDDKTHKQLSPKVVIAMVMNYGLASDGHHSIYNSVGSGRVYVFQDGTIIKGKWRKASHRAQLVFTNDDGTSLRLNAGQTWLTMVGSTGAVSYKP